MFRCLILGKFLILIWKNIDEHMYEIILIKLTYF